MSWMWISAAARSHEVELDPLLLQQAELAQGGVGILPLGEEHLVGEHRSRGGQGLRLCPKGPPRRRCGSGR